MNIDDRKKSSACPVTSKYFTDKPGMDESLSDFKETKKSCAGPKNTANTKNSKHKKIKRIKGQKDIKTALKAQKNELESYSKDFDNVCKKAGIDVDSEELQLAIALSKSLQDSETTFSKQQESTQLVTQDRVGKIRTTLQEYGFKVPEVKIKTSNTRKVRKCRNSYKLVATSDSEKKKIIANRYSHILLGNITDCSYFHSEVDTTSIPLYYLASSASYNILKLTDTFYVKNLMEKAKTTGNMLKDWSKIPGRPQSPQLFKARDINFSEIECSQDELDIVLGGSLRSCKNVLINKINFISNESANVLETSNSQEIIGINHCLNTLEEKDNIQENILKSVSTSKECRSGSPDIFDDDTSTIFDKSNHCIYLKEHTSQIKNKSVQRKTTDIIHITESLQFKTGSQNGYSCKALQTEMESNGNITKKKSIDLMELTDCVAFQPNSDQIFESLGPHSSQSSIKYNYTKRTSNDYMEITECVPALLEHMPVEDNVKLTESPALNEENIVEDGSVKTVINIHDEGINAYFHNNISLSQRHGNIDLTEDPKNSYIIELHNQTNHLEAKKSMEIMDLTQSSNTSDELPFVRLTVAKSNTLDDTIIVNINDDADINKLDTTTHDQAEIHIDLTQNIQRQSEASYRSFYEEYVHDHSESTNEPDEKKSMSTEKGQSDFHQIDLTQTNNIIITCNKDIDHDILECIDKKNTMQQKQSQSCNIDLTQSPKRKTRLCHSQSNSQEMFSLGNAFNLKFKSSNINTSQGLKVRSGSKTEEELVCIDDQELNSSKKQTLHVQGVPIEKYSYNYGECSDIDLTQNSNSSEESNSIQTTDLLLQSLKNVFEFNDPANNVSTEEAEIHIVKNSQRCSSLGKKGDVSIDYDDFVESNKHTNSTWTNSQSIIYEIAAENIDKNSKNSLGSNCSQNSEIFEISDKELDYSLHQSKLEIPQDNFGFGGISVMDELSNLDTSRKSIDVENNLMANNINYIEILPSVNVQAAKNEIKSHDFSPIKHRRITEIATPQKACTSNTITVVTPQNSELLIKTSNVTPMLDYESMTMSEIHEELDKYGIKPFKRKRAIQLLTHIYNQTHPIIEKYDDNLVSSPKRHKPNDKTYCSRKHISPRKLLKSPRKDLEINHGIDNHVTKLQLEPKSSTETHNIINTNEENVKNKINKGRGNNCLKEKRIVEERKAVNVDVESIQCGSNRVVYEMATKVPIKEIECEPEDWVFQKREKAKVHSCRVPLHIAFHNYVSSRRDLREAILCYQPVEIDVIHKDLVGYGHRYDPKDFLKFLDKKCITVKTKDNDGRNQKRS